MSTVYSHFLDTDQADLHHVPLRVKAGMLIAHRAVGYQVVGSQTTLDKSRGGKISFIVKALNESIVVFVCPI
jgi:hypothetical protein